MPVPGFAIVPGSLLSHKGESLRSTSKTRHRFATSSRHKTSACLDSALRKLPRHGKNDKNTTLQTKGEVYLVGTGPGDPRMLTLGAVELLQTAHVVLYDRLVSDEILSFINPAAEKVCVGKGRGIGTGIQSSIQEQLAHYAVRGKRVVRLKGGDPAIFGRLGDELCYLRESHELEAGVVPGVTAASGVAASLGFPLTHGGVSEELRVLTGHGGNERQFEVVQVTEGTTIVIYMGLRELAPMLERLQKCGARYDLPAVAVQNATRDVERVAWGRVGNLADRVGEAGLGSPTLIVIGEVVRMARDWEE